MSASMDPRDESDVSSLRVPPHSLEAEQSVLGGLMLDNAAWEQSGDIVREADFYRHEHRQIFASIAAMVNANQPADVLTVFERLQRIGKADACGGMVYLNSLSQSVASIANIRRYAEIVREHALNRALIAASDEAATLAFNDRGIDFDAKMEKVSALFAAIERRQTRQLPQRFGDIVVERIDHLSAMANGEVQPGWATHIPSLDRLLGGGGRPGNVIVLAARPSVGKSSFAQKLGQGFAADGLPTLFLSQEMPATELGERGISQLGEIDYGNLKTGALNQMEWGQLAHAAEAANLLPFYVDDQAALRVPDIIAKSRSVPGLKVLIIDYMQLSVAVGDYGGNKNAEVGEISAALKKLAKNMGVLVIVLSQLNRKVEERPGKRPMLSDLRDSGNIEQDADIIVFLWPVKELKGEQCSIVGCDVAKNRNGKKGAFALSFWGHYMRWAESALQLEELLKKDKTSYGSGGGLD